MAASGEVLEAYSSSPQLRNPTPGHDPKVPKSTGGTGRDRRAATWVKPGRSSERAQVTTPKEQGMHGTRSDREAEGHTAGKRNKTA